VPGVFKSTKENAACEWHAAFSISEDLRA